MVGDTFRLRIVVVVLWLVSVGAGFTMFLNYQTTSGKFGATPSYWPAEAGIKRDAKVDTLVMFAHPKCPCTRASIEELNRLLAECSGRVTARIFFFKPSRYSEDWVKTDLWRSAAAIPGVTVQEDIDGAQANLFGAETSGCVLLYDTAGRLLFKGGITGSRGHAGDNVGQSGIVALCRGYAVNLKETPVYGCSLLGKCETTTDGATQ